ncbi:hypothetical protein TNIN_479901, partial [Trichonephila inaurata madagascariensis]
YLFECFKEDAERFILFDEDVNINSYSEVNKSAKHLFSSLWILS